MEAEHIEAEGLLAFYENCHDGVVISSADGSILSANPACCRLFQLSEQDLRARGRQGLIDENDARWGALVGDGDGAELRRGPATVRRSDGTAVEVEVTATVYHSSTGQRRTCTVVRGAALAAVETDPAAQLELELSEGRERLRVWFEDAPIGKAIVGLDGTWSEVNPALCHLLGYGADELVHMTFQEVTHPEDLASTGAVVRQLLSGEISRHSMEKRYIHRDGSPVWAALHLSVLRGPDGKPVNFASHIEDITARKCNEDKVRQVNEQLSAANELLSSVMNRAVVNEARYRALVEHLPGTSVYVYDRAHCVQSAAGSGVRARGYDSAELIGQTVEQILPGDDGVVVGGHIDAAFEGRPAVVERRFEQSGADLLIDVVPVETELDGGPVEVLVVARDIGELRAREHSLAKAEARWRAAFDRAPVGMVELDMDGSVLLANLALSELLGYPAGAMVGRRLVEFLHPTDGERTEASELFASAGAGGLSLRERRLVRADGAEVWATIRGSRLAGADGEVDRLLLHVADVTGERSLRDQVEAERARMGALVEHGSDVITVADANNILSYASPALEKLVGRPVQTCLGRSMLELVHPEDHARLGRATVAFLASPEAIRTFECRVGRSDGTWRHIEATAVNRLHDPAVAGVITTSRDITERVEAAARLRHQATHDSLTGLANRALLLEVLDAALVRAERSGRPCAALFLDVDHFKRVNDTLGHSAGDQLLAIVGERLRGAVRPADRVARLGGDEFVVLAEDIVKAEHAVDIAERIRAAIAQPVQLPGRTVTPSCSIGIAVSAHHRADALLQEADTALYQAKEKGRNRWELYDQTMRLSAGKRLDAEEVLRSAISDERVTTVYQSIVDLGTGAVVGTAALARIETLDGTVIPPTEFIAAGEESGLIVPLGMIVLRQACAQRAGWGGTPLGVGRVSVNLSARQISAPNLITEVTKALAASQLAPEHLCIELTETALIDAGASTLASMHELRAMGVGIAVDDFGTGWSSLAYLRQFPIDTIKIAGSFVRGLGATEGDTELVRAIIGLAQALRLTCVADGIETALQARLLGELGCQYGQGYFFGRPQVLGSTGRLR